MSGEALPVIKLGEFDLAHCSQSDLDSNPGAKADQWRMEKCKSYDEKKVKRSFESII